MDIKDIEGGARLLQTSQEIEKQKELEEQKKQYEQAVMEVAKSNLPHEAKEGLIHGDATVAKDYSDILKFAPEEARNKIGNNEWRVLSMVGKNGFNYVDWRGEPKSFVIQNLQDLKDDDARERRVFKKALTREIGGLSDNSFLEYNGGRAMTPEEAQFVIDEQMGDLNLASESGMIKAKAIFNDLISDPNSADKVNARMNNKSVHVGEEGFFNSLGRMGAKALGSIAEEVGGIVNLIPGVDVGKDIIDAGNMLTQSATRAEDYGTYKKLKDENGNEYWGVENDNTGFGGGVAKVGNEIAGWAGFMALMGAGKAAKLGKLASGELLAASHTGKSMRNYELTEGEANKWDDIAASIVKGQAMAGLMAVGGKASEKLLTAGAKKVGEKMLPSVWEQMTNKMAGGYLDKETNALVRKFGEKGAGGIIRNFVARKVMSLPPEMLNMATFMSLDGLAEMSIDHAKMNKEQFESVYGKGTYDENFNNLAWRSAVEGAANGVEMALMGRILHLPGSAKTLGTNIGVYNSVRDGVKKNLKNVTINDNGKERVFALKLENGKTGYVVGKEKDGTYRVAVPKMADAKDLENIADAEYEYRNMSAEDVFKKSKTMGGKKTVDEYANEITNDILFNHKPDYLRNVNGRYVITETDAEGNTKHRDVNANDNGYAISYDKPRKMGEAAEQIREPIMRLWKLNDGKPIIVGEYAEGLQKEMANKGEISAEGNERLLRKDADGTRLVLDENGKIERIGDAKAEETKPAENVKPAEETKPAEAEEYRNAEGKKLYSFDGDHTWVYMENPEGKIRARARRLGEDGEFAKDEKGNYIEKDIETDAVDVEGMDKPKANTTETKETKDAESKEDDTLAESTNVFERDSMKSGNGEPIIMRNGKLNPKANADASETWDAIVDKYGEVGADGKKTLNEELTAIMLNEFKKKERNFNQAYNKYVSGKKHAEELAFVGQKMAEIEAQRQKEADAKAQKKVEDRAKPIKNVKDAVKRVKQLELFDEKGDPTAEAIGEKTEENVPTKYEGLKAKELNAILRDAIANKDVDTINEIIKTCKDKKGAYTSTKNNAEKALEDVNKVLEMERTKNDEDARKAEMMQKRIADENELADEFEKEYGKDFKKYSDTMLEDTIAEAKRLLEKNKGKEYASTRLRDIVDSAERELSRRNSVSKPTEEKQLTPEEQAESESRSRTRTSISNKSRATQEDISLNKKAVEEKHRISRAEMVELGNTLKKSGLVKDCIVLGEAELLKRYAHDAGADALRELTDADGVLYGYVTKGGKMMLNGDRLNANTPIHETAHLLFESYLRNGTLNDAWWTNAETLARESGALEALPTSYKSRPIREQVEEAIVRAVGERGSVKLKGSIYDKFKQFAKDKWSEFLSWFGINSAKTNATWKDLVESIREQALGENRTLEQEKAVAEFAKYDAEMYDEFSKANMTDGRSALEEKFSNEKRWADSRNKFIRWVGKLLGATQVGEMEHGKVTDNSMFSINQIINTFQVALRPVDTLLRTAYFNNYKLPDEADFVGNAAMMDARRTYEQSEFVANYHFPLLTQREKIIKMMEGKKVTIDGEEVDVDERLIDDYLTAVYAIEGLQNERLATKIEDKYRERVMVEGEKGIESKAEKVKEAVKKAIKNAEWIDEQIAKFNRGELFGGDESQFLDYLKARLRTRIKYAEKLKAKAVAIRRYAESKLAPGETLEDVYNKALVDISVNKIFNEVTGENQTLEDCTDLNSLVKHWNRTVRPNITTLSSFCGHTKFIKPMLELKQKVEDTINAERMKTCASDFFNKWMKVYGDRYVSEVTKLRECEKAVAQARQYGFTFEGETTPTLVQNNSITRTDGVGMTDKRANEIIRSMRRDIDTSELFKLQDLIDAETHFIRETSYKYGLIGKEQYEEYEKNIHYVPLRGFDREVDPLHEFNTYDGMESRESISNGITTEAWGRMSRADNIFDNLVRMGSSTINKGLQNVTKTDFGRWVYEALNGKQGGNGTLANFCHVGQLQKRTFSEETGAGKWEDCDEIPEKVTEQKGGYCYKGGYQYRMKGGGNSGAVHLNQAEFNAHVVRFMIGGQKFAVFFNDAEVARAINKKNEYVDKAFKSDFTKIMQRTTQLLSQQMTALSLDFIKSNGCRDAMFTYMRLVNDGYSRMDVVRTMKDALCDCFTFFLRGQSVPDLENMMKKGGATGWQEEAREASAASMDSVRDALRRERGDKFGTKLVDGFEDGVKKVFGITPIEVIRRIGESVEMSNRLACYRLKSRDYTESEAIKFAKDITTNFNQKGSMMYGNGVGTYMKMFVPFWNAAMQGANCFRNMIIQNPKAITRDMVSMFIASFVLQVLNREVFGDTEGGMPKEITQDSFSRASRWKIPIGKDLFIQVDLMHNVRSMADLAVNTCDLMYNDITMSEYFVRSIGSMADFTHFDFSRMLEEGISLEEIGIFANENLAPAFLVRPAIATMYNRNFFKTPIYKNHYDKNDDIPEWQMTVGDRTWRPLVSVSRKLNEWSGGTDNSRGSVNINPQQVQYILEESFPIIKQLEKPFALYEKASEGEYYDAAKQLPMLGKFLGSYPKDEISADKSVHDWDAEYKHWRNRTRDLYGLPDRTSEKKFNAMARAILSGQVKNAKTGKPMSAEEKTEMAYMLQMYEAHKIFRKYSEAERSAMKDAIINDNEESKKVAEDIEQQRNSVAFVMSYARYVYKHTQDAKRKDAWYNILADSEKFPEHYKNVAKGTEPLVVKKRK